MKRILITCTVLVALALLVAPALAAPSSVNKLTWRGSGVSADNPSLFGEIIGAQVRFDGVVTESTPGSWFGRGTVVSRKDNLKAHLEIINVEPISGSEVLLTGVATVTANGVMGSSQPFELTLDESTSECKLIIEESMDYSYVWWIPGLRSEEVFRSPDPTLPFPVAQFPSPYRSIVPPVDSGFCHGVRGPDRDSWRGSPGPGSHLFGGCFSMREHPAGYPDFTSTSTAGIRRSAG